MTRKDRWELILDIANRQTVMATQSELQDVFMETAVEQLELHYSNKQLEDLANLLPECNKYDIDFISTLKDIVEIGC